MPQIPTPMLSRTPSHQTFVPLRAHIGSSFVLPFALALRPLPFASALLPFALPLFFFPLPSPLSISTMNS
jgi:hypothetical protein